MDSIKKVVKEPSENQMNEKGRKIMEDLPIWRAILKMAIPSLIFMLIIGGYMFVDNVLAIQFAPDSYGGSKDIVRMGMSAFSPINSLIAAFSLLFGMGISTRVSINLGAKRIERARNTLKTGTMIGMAIGIILIPILMFSSKPWMSSQFESSSASTLSNMGFDYGWIIIMLIPFSFFNQFISSGLRVEGRNKAMMLPMIASIGINLLFDWILMGPAGMGIEGGAWATFISTVFVTFVYIVIILKKKDSIIRLSNMFGFKFKALSIIGIILVGISPFLRNFAQSITQTVEMNVIKDVSAEVYKQHGQIGEMIGSIKGINIKDIQYMFSNDTSIAGSVEFHKALATKDTETIYKAIESYAKLHTDTITNVDDYVFFNKNLIMASAFNNEIMPAVMKPITAVNDLHFEEIKNMIIQVVASNQMTLILTGVFPIFALFFPTMFAFAQAGRPIASYNFGAKKMDRVKQTFWWTILFASMTAVIIYFVATFALNYPLMHILGVSFDTAHGNSIAERATHVLRVMMIAMPMFGTAIGAMLLTGSTDRVIQATIISSLRGIVYFLPAIFIFKEIALSNPSNEFLFWWFYPVLAGASSLTSFVIAMFVLKHLDKKVITLDEKLGKIYSKIENRKWLKRKTK